MWDNTLPKNRFLRFCVLMAHRCGRHNVAMQSAALAFYLLFMIFPFLIFISALLGLLDLNITGMMTVLSDFLPEEVVDLLRMYFTYVTDNPSPQLMVFGLVFSIYFPMRATNSLMAAVRTAYHLGPPKGFITQWIKVLLYTVTLIVTIALTLSLMTFGERALWYTVEHFHLPEFLAKLWVTLRFPVAGAVSFLALFLLLRPGPGYHPTPEKYLSRRSVLSGGVDGVQLALFLLRQPLLPLLCALRFHRRRHCGADLAEPLGIHTDFGRGDERCAHQYAEGPSGAERQRTKDMNRLSNLSCGLAAGKEAVLWIQNCRNMQNY